MSVSPRWVSNDVRRLICCCCCLPGGGALAPVGAVCGEGEEDDFTTQECNDLVSAARRWVLETGRRCADFFPSLRSGPTADPYLASRPTLLSKVRSLNDARALLASNTICARVAAPTVSLVPQPAAPVPVGPTQYLQVFSGLSPVSFPYTDILTDFSEATRRCNVIKRDYDRAGYHGWACKVLDGVSGAVLYQVGG